MKTLGAFWFTEMGAAAPIGIIVVELDAPERQAFDNRDKTAWHKNRLTGKERAAFIGTAVPGNTLDGDIRKIVETGARFPLDVALKLV